MRTSEERVDALHQRMDALEQTIETRKFRTRSAVIASAGLILAVALALIISNLPVAMPGAAEQGATASIFTDHGALGYVVVALLAFILGGLVTVLCFRLKQNGGKKQEETQEAKQEEKNG